MVYCNSLECPACGKKSLPVAKGAEAVACQNPTCRYVFDSCGAVAGRWSVGFEEFVPSVETEVW
jgi:hypothetical protein